MRSRSAIVALAAGATVFVTLLVLVATGAADGLDEAVARFVHRHHSAAGGQVARGVADLLSPGVDAAVLAIGAGLVAHRRRRWRPVVVAAVVLVLVTTVVLSVKYAVDRPLPHSHGRPDQGFPSGHAAATAAFLGVLALLLARCRRELSRLLAVAAALSVVVSVALVYAGYHWLTDTVASMALGAATVGLATLAARDG